MGEKMAVLFRIRLFRLIYWWYVKVSSCFKASLRDWLYSRGLSVGVASETARVREVVDMVRPRSVLPSLVRVGSGSDGGYLLPNDLEGVTAVLSPGVGKLSDFELFFAERGVECLLVDGTVEGPAVNHPNFSFVSALVGSRDDDPYRTVSSLVEQVRTEGQDLVLQMDIEGAEWAALSATPTTTLAHFRIIVIEFHDFSNKLLFKHSLEDVADVFLRLTSTHTPVHVHPNNYGKALKVGGDVIPDVFELTLLRNDRVRRGSEHAKLPHPLDTENAGPSRSPGRYPSWWASQ